MKIAITGGSGFLGEEIVQFFRERGDEVLILTRNPKKESDVGWLHSRHKPERQLEGTEVFINLAGSSINDGRWNDKQKKEIYSSRMEATAELLRIIRALQQKPKVLINASGIGIYPPSLTAAYTEKTTETATDFLAKTVKDWERLANEAKLEGVRVAYARLAVVLEKHGGALPLMALPYKLFAGGTVGSGKQWLSWVHLHDAARAIAFAVDRPQIEGPFNVAAPDPKRMKEFGKELGRALGRPHWAPVPSFVLKTVLGDKSQLILEGQQVLPAVLLQHGFEFRFPNLRLALADIYS